MGTLGCINDMMQRDKENRQFRKQSSERMKETRNRLIGIGGRNDKTRNVSLEKWEKTQRQIAEKEEIDAKRLFRLKLWVLASLVLIVLLGWIVYLIF